MRHGERTVEVLLSECRQLDGYGTFIPQQAEKITSETNREFLNLIVMIKEKRCGKIQARVCANGKKQRWYIPKNNVTSTTLQL